MSEFNFGDRVYHPKYGECIFVEGWEYCDTGEQSWVTILSSCGATADVAPDSLELLPHPDTVRLNWLENNRAELGVFYDDELEKPKSAVYQAPDKAGCRVLLGHGSSYREAIDQSMKP